MPKKAKPEKALEKWVVIPDCHVPYEDPEAFGLMLRAAKAVGVKNCVILGDFADFYAVSSHDKDPTRILELHWEVECVKARLRELEAVFKGKRIFIGGNHEDRLARYLAKKAPELFTTIKVEQLFGLREGGWQYVPYKQYAKIGKLHLTHDVGKAGSGAHANALGAFQGNTVIGHTHRFGYVVEGTVRGEAHLGAMVGWLGDFDKVDYMHAAKARREWVHGFGLLYVEKSGCVHLSPIPIVNGKVVVEGKLVT